MEKRSNCRVSPYKKVGVQVSSDTVCINGVLRDLGSEGSCIWVRSQDDFPLYRDNRVTVRCQLGEINESWSDEILIGKVRWVEKREGETLIGIEFLDTDEYYHPRIASLRNQLVNLS